MLGRIRTTKELIAYAAVIALALLAASVSACGGGGASPAIGADQLPNSVTIEELPKAQQLEEGKAKSGKAV